MAPIHELPNLRHQVISKLASAGSDSDRRPASLGGQCNSQPAVQHLELPQQEDHSSAPW